MDTDGYRKFPALSSEHGLLQECTILIYFKIITLYFCQYNQERVYSADSEFNCTFLALQQWAMNMHGSHPTMKNCEGSTGTRNRLLRGQGRGFKVIEAPRGRPFLVRRGSSLWDWQFPKLL
jgi:hypothetical protein